METGRPDRFPSLNRGSATPVLVEFVFAIQRPFYQKKQVFSAVITALAAAPPKCLFFVKCLDFQDQ